MLVVKSLITCLNNNNNSISVTVSVVTEIMSASQKQLQMLRVMACQQTEAGTVHSLPSNAH